MAEKQSKRILYLHDYRSSTWGLHEATNRTISIHIPNTTGIFYWQARKELDGQTKTLSVELKDVSRVLSKHKSLDLIVVQLELNTHLDLTRKIREQKLSDAKIVLYPLLNTMSKEENLKTLTESGADFGIEIFDRAENITRAFGNILNGKTDGYIFNPELYRDENGILVPST